MFWSRLDLYLIKPLGANHVNTICYCLRQHAYGINGKTIVYDDNFVLVDNSFAVYTPLS